MNNKDKLIKLTAYLTQLTNKLSSGTPSKHAGHPAEFKQFLTREIEGVKSKIDSLKVQ